MNKRAPLLIFLVVLLVIGLVGLIFWNTIRTSFVAPLSAFILLIVDLLSAVDQGYLWALLLFILLILTITRLGRTKPTETVDRVVHIKPNYAGRLRFWEMQVYLLTRGRIPSRYSVHEVRRLLVQVLGYKQHLDMTEADRRLKAGELDLPLQYEEFSKLDQEAEELQDVLTEFFKTLASTLKGKRAQTIQAREKVLSDLVLYMENQLEIEHDH